MHLIEWNLALGYDFNLKINIILLKTKSNNVVHVIVERKHNNIQLIVEYN